MKKREDGIELLRIVAGLLIIAYHYCSEIPWETASSMGNKIVYSILGSWGGLAVLIFVAISAWFLTEREISWSLWKVLRLILETSFYSLCMFFAAVLAGGIPFEAKQLIKAAAAPFLGSYWFVTSYLLFYFLVPFLHRFVWSMNEAQLKRAVYVLTGIIVLFQMVIAGNPSWGILSIFCYIYVAVAYLKRVPGTFVEKHARPILIINYAVLALFCQIGHQTGISLIFGMGGGKNSFLVILEAICAVLCFRRVELKGRSLIHGMAGTVLGIYILHQHYLSKDYIWEFLHIWDAYQSKWFPLYLVTGVLLIFAAGGLIDILRKYILEQPFLRVLRKSKKLCSAVKWCDDSIKAEL